jgi:hypothetical protein
MSLTPSTLNGLSTRRKLDADSPSKCPFMPRDRITPDIEKWPPQALAEPVAFTDGSRPAYCRRSGQMVRVAAPN